MPPRLNSRYMAVEAEQDENGKRFLTEREPFRYDASLPGTRKHRVTSSDTLFTLAMKYFDPLPDAEHLWWIICEFQPDPILDPTLDLTRGRVLHIPSIRVVQEKVLGAG